MFCENCGHQLPDGAKFCGGCGETTKPVQAAYTAAAEPAPMRTLPPAPVYSYPAQTAYAPPRPAAYSGQTGGSEPLRVGQYIGMLLLMYVPLINIILLFMWSFGSSVNPNKKNFARASLILCAVSLIIMLIAGGAIIGVLGEIMGGYY